MIVPEYWSEAKLKQRIDGAQVTIKRFGWSDESEAAAHAHASKRAHEAMTRAVRGEKVRKVDHKIPYNGAEGLPIREEVVGRQDDVVITRNSYGALCLNTPDVLFADIDFDQAPAEGLSTAIYLFLILISAGVAYGYESYAVFIGLVVLSLFVAPILIRLANKMHTRLKGEPEDKALKIVESYVEMHPEVHLRLYRTPMGFRVMAMHQIYEPGSEATNQILQALKSDPIYIRMCRNQHCFRARVSPKPWRIGIDRIVPRPGVWPIRNERMPARIDWVKKYDRRAAHFAACRFVKELGSGKSVVKTRQLQALHDQMCRAESGLEIA
ncbi:hypothetical protein ACONUD_17595 [Microbulbifer harenosus]|uniref:Uncharacterized protein n=1 Tax=Microbulbifer harenosus TaxID=2576840 RepID=A0ABY2UJF0_9GAMM|nr:hypothetical protein [Microbulbifer harenosus]TLM78242.1 hypothetical protein FDY93_07400 [Microbulbifer harenosus]